jgi:predicted solute-binding protein
MMLRDADAALVIGDPALRLEPTQLPYQWLDLAGEWQSLTGLPFVFAAWAGKPGLPLHRLSELTVASYHFGKERIAEIVQSEAGPRGISEALADVYLRHHLWYELGPQEYRGLEAFLKLAGLAEVHV